MSHSTVRGNAERYHRLPMPDYLFDVNKRLNRAKSNFDRFDSELSEYWRLPSGPYRAVTELKDGSRGECLIVARVQQHPDWALLVADILTDCRFALDFLAYQLVIRNTGQDPPPDPEDIEFPIFVDPLIFLERNKQGQPTKRSGLRKIQNMSQAVQSYITDVQPYKVDPANPRHAGIWLLHELCNVYKHRLLEPALLVLKELKVTFQIIGDVRVEDAEGFQLGGKELTDGTPIGRFRLVAGPNGKGAKVQVETEPNAQICFPKGSPAEMILVHDVLNGTVGTIDQIVTELARIGDLA